MLRRRLVSGSCSPLSSKYPQMASTLTSSGQNNPAASACIPQNGAGLPATESIPAWPSSREVNCASMCFSSVLSQQAPVERQSAAARGRDDGGVGSEGGHRAPVEEPYKPGSVVTAQA